MIRYSASRGILYSAPPGPESAEENAAEATAEAAEPADADAAAADD